MKKYQIVKAYTDKYTKEDRLVGQKIELDADRAKELKDYVEEVREKKGKKDE